MYGCKIKSGLWCSPDSQYYSLCRILYLCLPLSPPILCGFSTIDWFSATMGIFLVALAVCVFNCFSMCFVCLVPTSFPYIVFRLLEYEIRTLSLFFWSVRNLPLQFWILLIKSQLNQLLFVIFILFFVHMYFYALLFFYQKSITIL